LKKVETLARSGQFDKTAGLVDKLTIGAVMTATRNPIVAGSFFGGREAARFLGPRFRALQAGPTREAARAQGLIPLAGPAATITNK